ncbi:MAG: DUF1538 domain-containing protein [Dehalococcoidaceae bacterium]|nr:DUF1538 domain-containing protein [Dehalococcoidaceae bacterium]
MLRIIREITLEVLQAILPLTLGVIAINFMFIRMPTQVFVQFIFGAVMVIGGMILFLLGVRLGILPMGEAIGSELPKRRFVPYILAVAFLLGFSVTVAEPDVMVLSDQVNTVSGGSISNTLLVGVIAVGVGFFVAAAILRIVLGFPITYMLAAGYAAIIILSFFTPPQFVPVAFDAGGVTTGPVTVPVILALGIGFSSVLAGRSTLGDGFGLIGLASIGPVIGVMLMGVILY